MDLPRPLCRLLLELRRGAVEPRGIGDDDLGDGVLLLAVGDADLEDDLASVADPDQFGLFR